MPSQLSDKQYLYRVVANHNATVVVQDANEKIFRCVTRKKLGTVVAGDWVHLEKQATGNPAITAIAQRAGVLERPTRRGELKPIAANLSQLLVVSACAPGIDSRLIDSYCCAAELAGIEPILVINKADLLDKDGLTNATKMLNAYERVGYRGVLTSAKSATAADDLKPLLNGHTSVLVGQSGVGKSSIVNTLLPEKAIRTSELSPTTGLGGHTTTATTLYNLTCGGCLIDSPGVRDFAPGTISQTELGQAFREFRNYSDGCKFNNCIHRAEPDCAVQQAVKSGEIADFRYNNYLKLLDRDTQAAITK